MNEKNEGIRTIVRPFLCGWFSVTWVIFIFWIYSAGGTITDVPWIYTGITVGMNSWYFGERFWAKYTQKE